MPTPNAAAGADIVVDEGQAVPLDGSKSSDGNGTIVAYQWSQIAGPAVTLADPAASMLFNVNDGDFRSRLDMGQSIGIDFFGRHGYYLMFAAPGNGPLVPGVYERATRYPLHGTGPGLDLSAAGNGCNRLTGRFVVVLQTTFSGKLTPVSADPRCSLTSTAATCAISQLRAGGRETLQLVVSPAVRARCPRRRAARPVAPRPSGRSRRRRRFNSGATGDGTRISTRSIAPRSFSSFIRSHKRAEPDTGGL